MTLDRRSFFALLAGAGTGNKTVFGAGGFPFEDVPPSVSGITWVHDNGFSINRYLPETMPPGCAFVDFDNDGWMDIFIVNSGPCDFFTPKTPLKNCLYKNNRDGTFTDVADKSGVAITKSFGMGVAAGDYDNDGFQDLLITGVGGLTLYHNNGDGTFADVTQRSGLGGTEWTTSAVWFDYDNDGKLDLYVCGFALYGPSERFTCGDNKAGKHYYCIPKRFKSGPSFLFHNNGDGTFKLVSKGTVIEKSLGKGMGVVATDVNNDGLVDLFVTNDTVQNFLFLNRGNGRFEEAALAADVGFSANGDARSGMGVDAGDINNDGWEDLFVANVDHEMFSVYENLKNETFTDKAALHSVAQATRFMSGWGSKYFDYDNDGWLDLILSGGHPDDMIGEFSQQVKYKVPFLLFHNDSGKMRNVTAEAGPAFTKAWASRGLAVGDFNNDGKLDVLVANCNDAPVLLKNTTDNGNHWLGLLLQGVTCNRDAVGAKLTYSAGGVTRSRRRNAGGSYLSSHDPRIVLGLGTASKIDWLELKWPLPSGKVERFTDVPVDRYVRIVEGKGILQL